MNTAQKAAIRANLAHLCDELEVDEVIYHLRVKNILTKEIVQRISKEPDDKAKALFLMDHLQNRDDAWDALLEALTEAKQSYLADLLSSTLKVESPYEAIVDSKLQQLQRKLRQYIKEDCEIIQQAWEDYLPVKKLALTFQKLKVIETNWKETFAKNIESEDYSYLRDESIRIFLIEGDPGIGKSTYVNKIALDWANQHPLLNETFDFVLITSWVNLGENDWKKSIISVFGNAMNADILRDLLKSSKVLIILDGYDENPTKKVLEEITAKHDPITGDRISARLLITTRGSHVEDFEHLKNKIWLRILGFDQKSAVTFIKTQLKNNENIEEILTAHASLVEIVKNPLCATMIAATELTMKLLEMEPQMRIKEIFDSFLKFQKNRFFDKFPKADPREYDRMVERLAQYALNYLSLPHKEELLKTLGIDICITPPELTKEWLKMGLVQSFKQQRPDEQIEQINFLHQTLAEYHAAKYVAKHARRVESYKNLELFSYTPILFQSLVFGLRKDLFVAAVESFSSLSPGIPFVPLPLDEMMTVLQSSKRDVLNLFQWIIDERSIDKIKTDLPGQEISFHHCDINLMKLNWSLTKHDKVTALWFRYCKIAVKNFDEFFQFIENKFPKLHRLGLWDNSDRRFNSGNIWITLTSDTETPQNVEVCCKNIEYLLEILQSIKLQNYSAVEMRMWNVESDRYDEIFAACQTTMSPVTLTSYWVDRLSLKVPLKKLNNLEIHYCHLTVEDIVALCSFQNLSEVIIDRSKLLETSNQDRRNRENLHLKVNQIRIEYSDEILVFLLKNVSMKGNSAEIKMSPMVETNFTQHLSTAQHRWYFNEELIIWVTNDDDVEVIANSIISLLPLSACLQFKDRDDSGNYKAEYSIRSNTSDDTPIKLILHISKVELFVELTKCLPEKLQLKSYSIVGIPIIN